jgi:carbonic anhydrase
VSSDVHAHAGDSHGQPTVSAEEALARLVAGNERYVSGRPRYTAMSREDLAELAKGQQPFATLLGCADSRVPPELIFDVGPGELFVIRVAGNVLSAEVAGSLQYAGVHLNTPLFVVMGHENCGAVQAALASRAEGIQHHSRIQILVDSILPAMAHVDLSLPPERQLAQAVEANVRETLRVIRESPEGRMRTAEGVRKLVGAIYDLSSGRVRFLDAG